MRGGARPALLLADAARTIFSGQQNSNNILNRHVRGLVFGGMDGILTTFALLAAVAGSQKTSVSLTLVIGISTVLADALSMAAGEFLSAKAENEMDPASVSPSDPRPLEKALAMFLAFSFFGSMPLLGYIGTALLTRFTSLSQNSPDYFSMSVVITAVTLFALGTIKSTFGGASNWWQSGLEVTAAGGAAACVAFYTAKVIDRVLT